MEEEIMFVIAENIIIADKISQIKHDFEYDSEKGDKLKKTVISNQLNMLRDHYQGK